VNKSRTSSDPQGPSTAQEIVALDDPLAQPHAADVDDLLVALNTTRHGLSGGEAKDRLQRFGPNALPHTAPAGFGALFIRQFSSPLIYVLLFAAAVSLVIREWSDAVLIAAVLLVNAVIGTLQEFSAQRAAEALNKLVTTQSRVLRDGDAFLVESEELVPGDIVRLESGDKVPADMRLLSGRDLEVDESLLTGESETVTKMPTRTCPPMPRWATVSTWSSPERWSAAGGIPRLVVHTGTHTQLGKIAAGVLGRRPVKAPLIVRMERFTRRIAIAVGLPR
jgi:Ca2+-transporting ATPase